VDLLVRKESKAATLLFLLKVNLEKIRSTVSPRVMWIASFPGAVIDGVSFVDCIFRGVRSPEVVEASGSILFRNVKIEPAEKSRSLNEPSIGVPK